MSTTYGSPAHNITTKMKVQPAKFAILAILRSAQGPLSPSNGCSSYIGYNRAFVNPFDQFIISRPLRELLKKSLVV
jgi:hypothetical protein